MTKTLYSQAEQDDFDDIAADYRNEQAYHDSLSTLPLPKDGKIARYLKLMDSPDRYTADVVYFDRVTGNEITRYDGADPANTRFDYGATPDADIFKHKGLDIKEMIDKAQQQVPDDVIRLKVSQYNDYDDYDDYDDRDDFDPEVDGYD